MNTTSPKSSLVKLGLHSKTKPFRVMVLGQSGVGKTGEFTHGLNIKGRNQLRAGGGAEIRDDVKDSVHVELML